MAEAGGRTISGVRRDVTRKLSEVGIETPEIDARRLLELATGLSAEALACSPGRELSAAELAAFDGYVARRLSHEPVSRIAGYRDFYGRRFLISPATLDPRPETETLVDTVLDYARRLAARRQSPRILDIGTGTGCILLTLLAEIDGATGTGCDISQPALNIAHRNAAALQLSGRVQFVNGRSFEKIDGTFDIVVSNPPYIAAAAIAGLAPEVRDFDPLEALDGGADGLAVYREIAAGLKAVLPDGLLVVETGYDQAEAVAALFRAEFGQSIAAQQLVADLAGHARCVAMEIHG